MGRHAAGSELSAALRNLPLRSALSVAVFSQFRLPRPGLRDSFAQPCRKAFPGWLVAPMRARISAPRKANRAPQTGRLYQGPAYPQRMAEGRGFEQAFTAGDRASCPARRISKCAERSACIGIARPAPSHDQHGRRLPDYGTHPRRKPRRTCLTVPFRKPGSIEHNPKSEPVRFRICGDWKQWQTTKC